MKRKIIVFVALLLPMLSHAQQVAYSYDAAGNRISRHVVNGGSQAPRRSLETTQMNLSQPIVSVGPNPTSGPLTVSLSRLSDDDECQLLLSNMAGQVLVQHVLTSPQAVLDLSPYANGYYLLKVVLNDQATTYKIIKN